MRTTSRRSSLSRLWARLTGQTEVTRGRSARLTLTSLEDRTVPAVVLSDTYDWVYDDGPIATVEVTVTDAPGQAGRLLWNYQLDMHDFVYDAVQAGMFILNTGDATGIADLTASNGWTGYAGVLMGEPNVIHWQDQTFGLNTIAPGGSAEFSFTTPAFSSIATTYGEVADGEFAVPRGGMVATPGTPPPPTVTVTRVADAAEGEDDGKFLLTRTGDTSGTLTVPYSLGGSATPGVDYDALGGSITFAPGSATAILRVVPKIDGAVEGDETVAVTLGTGIGHTLGSPSSATLSIIDVPAGGVTGTVWVDTNANGVKDGSEVTLSGVTVSLLDASGSPAKNADGTTVGSVTTGAGGTYSFGNLFPQGYILQFTAPSGYVLSGSGNTQQLVVLVTPGQTQPIDQPVYGGSQLSTVSGLALAYLDPGLSGPAVGLSGVSISLLSGSTVVASTTTGSSGAYAFPNLSPGTYSAQFTAPSGYRFSESGLSTLTAAVSTPGPLSTLNVVAYQPASLSGTAWVDANQDGQMGSGESGLAGVTVELLDDAWGVVASATTASGGLYSITGLAPGSYRLMFTAPSGYSLSGNSNVLFGYLSVGSGGAATRNVPAFTATQSSVISGRVWTDADGNGFQDAGESGLSGVAVAVKSNGTTVATTNTNASGDYSVTSLSPGTYTVQLTAPTGYVLAASRATIWSTEVGTPGPAAIVNAAAYQPASVSGTVWVDSDNDGVKDTGETAVDGATVSFYGRDGGVAGTATANASGDYSAANLSPDLYRVVVEAPASFALNGMPAAVKVPLILPSGGNIVLPVAYNKADPDKNKLKFESATIKELFDSLNDAAAKKGEFAQIVIDKFLKRLMGVDPTKEADQAKWAKEKLVYGVLKDNTNTRTSGGAMSGVRISVDDFQNAPQKDKASIIQNIEKQFVFYDADGKKILDKPLTLYLVEGFAVDANGVAKGPDVHLISGPVGFDIGKIVTKIEVTMKFTAGWGTYKDKAQPTTVTHFHPEGPEPPPKDAITWLGKTTTYEVKFTLDQATGKWTWSDTSTGLTATGTDNTIDKK